jgi:hypothetical protein
MRYYALNYPFLLNTALNTANKELSSNISPQRYYVLVAIFILHRRREAITVRSTGDMLINNNRQVNRNWLNAVMVDLQRSGWLSSVPGRRRAFTTKIYTVEPAMILFLNTLEKKLRLARVWKEKESNWHKRVIKQHG